MVLDIDKEAKEEVEVEVLCAVPPMQVKGARGGDDGGGGGGA